MLPVVGLSMFVQVLDELASSVEEMDPEKVVVLSKRAVDAGIDPAEIVENGIAKGLRKVGERFEKGEAFLTDLVGAAAAAKKALDDILRPAMAKARTAQRSLGKAVVGTVAGDIHDIGKNIVAAMLFASGFEVVDLGTDVSVDDFASRSSEVGAKIVGSSALLSTTLPVQREIINEFVKRKIRDRYKLLVGGAPATEQWAKEIKADGYAPNAVDAIKLAKSVLGLR
jgi:corrinoid protein of di/trimethylamine methyltransferase